MVCLVTQAASLLLRTHAHSFSIRKEVNKVAPVHVSGYGTRTECSAVRILGCLCVYTSADCSQSFALLYSISLQVFQ